MMTVKKEGLSQLVAPVTLYPQVPINVRMNNKKQVQTAGESAAQVMVDTSTRGQCQALAKRAVLVIRNQGHEA